MAVMQAQIQALLAAAGGERGGTGPNTGSHMEVAKPAIFNGEAGRVGGFITACRLYIKMKLRGNTVEETSAVGVNLCAGRISGCLEGKHYGGIRIGGSRV